MENQTNTEKPVSKGEMIELLNATTGELKKTFANKNDLETSIGDLRKTFATKSDLETSLASAKKDVEELLLKQTSVILEAVDETLDRRLSEKLDPFIIKLDKFLDSAETLKQENASEAAQLRRHTDTLDDHEERIKKLELQPQS